MSIDISFVAHEVNESIGMIVSRLDREKREAEIRLYGVLWYLWEAELISQDKAVQLARQPLDELIGICVEWRNRKNNDEIISTEEYFND